MATFIYEPKVRVQIMVPDHDDGAGRFHFAATVADHDTGKLRSLEGRQLSTLVPSIARYLPLHGSDINGNPLNVEMQAWYHLRGIINPGERGADNRPHTDLIATLRSLLRIDNQRLTKMVDSLIMLAREMPDDDIVLDRLRAEIFELGPVWAKQASEAICNIPLIMENGNGVQRAG